MNCTNNSACDIFNGDIAGFGVRMSFYMQNIILVLLVDRSRTDAGNALWTFITTSFGLAIAALVQVRNNTLSLLEGILVSQLSWFANIGTFLALASYSRSKDDNRTVKVAAVVQGYFSMILTIIMWTYAEKLGPPSCDFKLVSLVGELNALGSGRKFALSLASLTILLYTCVTLIEFRILQKRKRLQEEPELERPATFVNSPTGDSNAPATQLHRRKWSTSSSRKRKHQKERKKWLGIEVDSVFFGILFFQIITFTYFILTTELIISRNKASTGSDFSFGQILSLTVVIPSMIALVRGFRKNRIAKPHPHENQQEQEDNSRSGVPTLRGNPSSPIALHPVPRLELSLRGGRPSGESAFVQSNITLEEGRN